MSYCLAIDVGTTATKSIVVDAEGRVAGAAAEGYDLLTPHPGWVEENPQDWWAAVKATVPAALAEAGVQADAIQAIGLSGQMHGAVLLDAGGQVIRPCIIWADSRTARQCEWITAQAGGMSRLLELAANPALVGFTAGKILWVRENEPANFARVHKVLLPKDYIRYRLTGDYVTDAAGASGTLLLDIRRRCWSQELLGCMGLSEDLLPRIVGSEEIGGALTAAAAHEIGLAEDTPVVGGGGDAVMASVGSGLVRPGAAVSVIGTGGNFTAVTPEYACDPAGRIHTFCHPAGDRWLFMGVQQAAGLALKWLRDNLGLLAAERARSGDADGYDLFTAEAQRAPPGAEGLIFLPYLNGERTPHLDPDAKGVLFGATARHTHAHLIRAAMEGVVYALRDALEIMRSLGVTVDHVVASGGGAQSPFWRQLQADILGTEVVTTTSTEGSAYGAALAAAVGAGFFETFDEAAEKTIRVETTTSPRNELKALYGDYYGLYRELYAPLRTSFKTVTAINLKHAAAD